MVDMVEHSARDVTDKGNYLKVNHSGKMRRTAGEYMSEWFLLVFSAVMGTFPLCLPFRQFVFVRVIDVSR
jgi:hypothetical protein